MTTKLDYISGATIIPEGAFSISPSSVNKFIEKPHVWYREMLLGEKDFNQSTSTVLGTITHFCAEEFITNKKVDYIEIYKYIYSNCCLPNADIEAQFNSYAPYSLSKDDEADIDAWLRTNSVSTEVDANHILDQWRIMGQTLIDHLRQTGIPQQAEPLVKAEVKPGYWASGSIDAIRNGQVIDYKTTSDKTPKSYIPMNYKYQLLTYAWICHKNNILIDRISIIWVTQSELNRISEKTGKPLKDYPSQAVTVTEVVTQADLDFIEGILSMIADTVQASTDYPHLRHVLWKDPRLKEQS